MDKKKIIMPCLVALGLLTGVLGQRYLRPQTQQEEAVANSTASELSSDAFSLRFFQHGLKEKETGNVLVAPHCITNALLSLQDIAAGRTREELQALQLKESRVLRATEPLSTALLGVDLNLPRKEGRFPAMPLPFSENVPMALSLFNGSIGAAMGKGEFQLVDSKMVTERTKLLAAATASFSAEWETPFNSANSRTADFDSASGGMPHFRQMRSRGQFRSAKAEDGSWKAVAIPFKSKAAGEPLVCIGILPAGSARDFAANLTPEMLTGIRKSLAEASPQDMLVELPLLELQIFPYDMRDSLRRLGLKALFDIETADFSPLTPEKIHLGAFIHSVSLSLVESKDSAKADDSLDYAPEYISFNRPYIWLIADLATDTPIDFIGLTEEM